jgi:hypothetical protein
MDEKNKYEEAIKKTIDSVKDGYDIHYVLDNIKDILHGGMPSYSGVIQIKKNNLNLYYHFQIMDNNFRFLNIGKIFGNGKEDKNGLEKIAQLNKTLAAKLNLQLIEKRLNLDAIEEGILKA